MKYLEYLILESLSPTDIYKKYYSDIDIDTFLKIVTADPTSKPYSDSNVSVSKIGRYSKWMLKLYKEKKLLLEDLYKFTRTLNLFHTLNVRGILRKNNIPADINLYKDLPHLWSTIKDFYNEESSEVIPINKSEYEVFWETKECQVIIPLTHKASCHFGKDSDWCTASDSDSYYEQYSKQEPLFIIIDKSDPKYKFQFHLVSSQFADIDDNMLYYGDILEVLENMSLDDDDFIESVFKRCGVLKEDKYEIGIGDLIYFKDFNNPEYKGWQLKFENWIAFEDKISLSGDVSDDFIETILSEDYLADELFYSEYSIDHLGDLDISYDIFIKILDKLKEYNAGIFEDEEFKKLIDVQNKSIECSEVLKILEYFSEYDEDDTFDTSQIIYAIQNAYNNAIINDMYNHYRDTIISDISDSFNFIGEPVYVDNHYIVKIKYANLVDIFIRNFDDDVSEDDNIINLYVGDYYGYPDQKEIDQYIEDELYNI